MTSNTRFSNHLEYHHLFLYRLLHSGTVFTAFNLASEPISRLYNFYLVATITVIPVEKRTEMGGRPRL